MTQTKYDKAVSVCFSGHRNIPFLYRKQLKLQLKAAITKAYAGGYRHFYCGCAMGFDMLAAEVALALQSELSGLQVIAVVPYRGQSERWNDAMKARYDTILCNSDGCYHPERTLLPWLFASTQRLYGFSQFVSYCLV